MELLDDRCGNVILGGSAEFLPDSYHPGQIDVQTAGNIDFYSIANHEYFSIKFYWLLLPESV